VIRSANGSRPLWFTLRVALARYGRPLEATARDHRHSGWRMGRWFAACSDKPVGDHAMTGAVRASCRSAARAAGRAPRVALMAAATVGLPKVEMSYVGE
jgi:hypothetical protein